MDADYLLLLLSIFAGGCWIGRWLHRCIRRFPAHFPLKDQLTSLWRQGDCAGCDAWETGVQHVPVLGPLVADRCRKCDRRIDRRRLIVELLTGSLLTLLYWVEIPGVGVLAKDSGLFTQGQPAGPECVSGLWSESVWLHLRYLLHAVMICSLIVATMIDLELCIIPDGCTVPAMIAAVLVSTAVGQTWLVPVWFQDASVVSLLRNLLPDGLQGMAFEWDAAAFAAAHPHIHGFLASVAGLMAGAGATWLVRAIGFLTLRQEAMGDGDVVLMAMIGAVLGWQPVLVVFMLASALAVVPALLLSSRRQDDSPFYFPYGPWLSLAAVVLLLGWSHIWPAAKVFFDLGPGFFLVGILMFVGLAAMLWGIYLVKRALGLAGPDGPFIEWSSADHLKYYDSERPDEQTGLWKTEQWPGQRSGRGLQNYHRWRWPE